jgi:hypothetical protein
MKSSQALEKEGAVVGESRGALPLEEHDRRLVENVHPPGWPARRPRP